MQNGGLLKGAMFIHLKKDLDVVSIDWMGCEEPHDSENQVDEPLTEYGIRKKVQELLAGIRTDLDSFSEAEAYALMTSGYRMTDFYLPQVQVLPIHRQDAGGWDFLEIESVMRYASTTDIGYQRFLRLLRSAGSRMFRIWSQSRVLLLVTSLLAVVAVVIGAWLVFEGDPSRVSVTINGWTILAAIILTILHASP